MQRMECSSVSWNEVKGWSAECTNPSSPSLVDIDTRRRATSLSSSSFLPHTLRPHAMHDAPSQHHHHHAPPKKRSLSSRQFAEHVRVSRDLVTSLAALPPVGQLGDGDVNSLLLSEWGARRSCADGPQNRNPSTIQSIAHCLLF